MSIDNIVTVQNQIRENSDDLQGFLKDLDSWEKDMKKKEEEMKLLQVSEEQVIPPIRNSLSRSKKKSRQCKNKKGSAPKEEPISSYNYKAWEHYNADAELKKLDEEKKDSSNSESSDSEEQLSVQRNKQLALIKKDKGNDLFKAGNYVSAIESYTVGMQLDPENALLPANRAMAFLKTEQFQAAENDCTLCLSLDPSYVKAYLRRGTARKALEKFDLALADFLTALKLEPDNKQAQMEINKLEKKSFPEIEVTYDSPEEFKERLKEEFLSNAVEQKNNKESSSVGTVKSHDLLKAKSVESTSAYSYELENAIAKLEQKLPPIPTASYQFLTDWKKISKYPDLKYLYLKQFPPEKFSELFKHYMEPEVFPEILSTLSTSFIENGDDILPYMIHLASVGRFNTMLMFLSDDEIKDLRKLLSYAEMSGYPSSEVEALVKLYKV